MRGGLLGCVLSLVLLAGCKSMPHAENVPISWVVREIQGRPVIPGTKLTLTFTDDGRVTGLGGINRFSGPMKGDDGQITIGPLMSTKMAGPPDLMEQEQRYFVALEGAERYAFPMGNLTLYSKGSERPTLFRQVNQIENTVTGRVSCHEPINLPPDASLELRLVDVSRADAAPDVISTETITSLKGFPILFALRFDPATIDPGRYYAVQAKIFAGGRPLLVSRQSYFVLTQDNASSVDIQVERFKTSKAE